ncbi:conserved hypothetical protein [Chloroherpeton thalassium ATCC 35110]|uniref:ABC-type Fe3+ transport system periplasmic component-like protein n=1 Tax=Chloroherpeton thalassium (strain ATCC 35110 / GB-78) TaxID=517418 RepID=B3QTU5_CHLT3|nr:ABC transporter substrate-binding protein [Chloroherpeton thalassium]ACF14293.1 conserved hypothetical protein [Chloroherpeton thalassium ATCC 35110]
MMKSLYETQYHRNGQVTCEIEKSNGNTKSNSLLKEGSINLYIKMSCPLKGIVERAIREFVALYNASHSVPIYSPMFRQVNISAIDAELKSAHLEAQLPDVLIASELDTLFSGKLREKFIDTGIYTGITSKAALTAMPETFRKLATQHNIGILAAGYWRALYDLTIAVCTPPPRRWTDLIDPLYKDLITVHDCRGKTSITTLLILLKEQFGSNAVTDFARNIRSIRHFSEILRRIDSNEIYRTPYNILPNASIVQMQSQKRAIVLEFEDGPVLSPMFMFVKTSKLEDCKPLVDFFHSNIMRDALVRSGFSFAEDIHWQKPFLFPSWDYLLSKDYETCTAALDDELKSSLRHDVFH